MIGSILVNTKFDFFIKIFMPNKKIMSHKIFKVHILLVLHAKK